MSTGIRTRFNTRRLCVITVVALFLSGLGEAAPTPVKLISKDGDSIDAVVEAIRNHSQTLTVMLEQRSARNDVVSHTSPIVLENIATPELNAVVTFSKDYAFDEDEAAAKWVRQTFMSMDDGYYALLTAACRLRMPTLGRALLSLKPNWGDIRAMTNTSLPRNSEAFLFMVEHCPIIADLRQHAKTEEQKLIVDRIPYAVVYGESRERDVAIVNEATWDAMFGNVLQWATAKTNVHLVDLLADIQGINANINTGRDYMTTPLHWAVANGNERIVRRLLEIPGIDVTERIVPVGSTPLHVASFWGYNEIVQLLLHAKGVDVNARDCQEKTPLVLAAEKGHLDVVESLLEFRGFDVDVNAKDHQQQTALDRAKEAGHGEVAALLERRCPGAVKRFTGTFKHLWPKLT
ncbi:unnamed protein product (mitochondrion) [Plasmodiophora brassicae]|uniref:Uncharacterized protein n=1 Tax=Plasmodiophora brassicae TaxID=37360 RepID=A0A0G4ITW2_PLABS|nr:hypothetical protein PBRA_006690 [Plasmodiophora brassicae]SPQ95797.1 unnamed protein product [Plasmodiophora brassicae]